MTCLEMHWRLLTDPYRLDAEMFHHVAGCAACRAVSDAVIAFEMRLRAAFDVAASPHLTEPFSDSSG